MSLTPPDQTPALPTLAVTNLQTLGQDVGKMLAAMLATYGLVQKSQTTEIIDIVTSIVLAGGAMAWTYVMHRLHAAKAVAAVTTATLSK